MLKKVFLNKIEERYGSKVVYNCDCEALSEHIFHTTRERISVATLKRLFGLVTLSVEPRKSTLDILAKYIGYPSYDVMVAEEDNSIQISEFAAINEISSADLAVGTILQISYDPGRRIVMTYLGEDYFVVNKSFKSKLNQGDKVRITHLAVGFPILFSNVIRDGANLGSYQAAKIGGLSTLEVLD